MLLSEMAESLLNDLGAGKLSESTIKGQLSLIYDQAKAQEMEIEAKQAQIQHLEKRITELEVKLHKQEEAEQTKSGNGRLHELSEKILKLLFDTDENDGIVTTEEMAQKFGIQKSVAHGHCDILYKAEMIEMAGYNAFYIITNGRAYVMKFLLT